MAFNGKEQRPKMGINDESLEQINTFKFLGCDVSYTQSQDMEAKVQRFQQLTGTTKSTLRKKVMKEKVKML